MLFSRSRSLQIMAIVALPAALFLTGCSKSKPKPEVRLARTTTTSLDGANGALTADANGGFAPGAGWSPNGAPPTGDLGSAGSMSLAGNGTGTGADAFGTRTGTMDETGSLANTASLDGVEGAVLTSELEMIHFDYDVAEVPEAWKATLIEHATWMKANSTMMVQIEGHCDERGTEEYNVSLGQRRADAVRNFLVEQGVDANRLSTISYGKMRPMSFDATPEALALNRRAMFLVYQNTDNSVASASTGF